MTNQPLYQYQPAHPLTASQETALKQVRAMWPDHRWSFVPGFESYYLASDQGIVFSTISETPCALHKDQKDCSHVMLSNGSEETYIPVARVVASCFIPNYDMHNMYVVHINGKREDNRAINLQVVAQPDMVAEMLRVTEKKRTARTPSQLSPDKLEALFAARAAGASLKAIANVLGVTSATVLYHLQKRQRQLGGLTIS